MGWKGKRKDEKQVMVVGSGFKSNIFKLMVLHNNTSFFNDFCDWTVVYVLSVFFLFNFHLPGENCKFNNYEQ